MNTSSFLPEDYLAQKAERRTNLISLSLFVVVMVAVLGAFLVTNRQWKQIKKQQAQINLAYQQAGEQIQEVNELEQQKNEMLRKAEIVSALVERVPRSILMAELINRMPNRLGLIKFDLKSEKIRKIRTAKSLRATGRHAVGPSRGQTLREASEAVKKIEAPRYTVTITMVGLAPTDLEVSRYLAELNKYPLLENVSLEYSLEKEFEGELMREFKILMVLSSDADVRQINPLTIPRNFRNPMRDDSVIGANSQSPLRSLASGSGRQEN